VRCSCPCSLSVSALAVGLVHYAERACCVLKMMAYALRSFTSQPPGKGVGPPGVMVEPS